jgi:pimeloyl-ACP methyl ester carboxylesterase
MTTWHDGFDRRTLLKLIAVAGAGTPVAASAHPRPAEASGVIQTGSRVDAVGVGIPYDEIDDLNRRLETTRWPPDTPGESWAYGTDRRYLEDLLAYWRTRYDWRRQEAALNTFEHFSTTIDGQLIHFLHHRGRGESPLPLVMTHGWPGTIWEMLPAVGPLSDPVAHGGDPNDAFDVVVPSIPGFGFSGEPLEGTDYSRTAELWVALMERLDYRRFGAYGSDWGRLVTRQLGASFPDRLIGIITPGAPPQAEREPETDEERDYLESRARWAIDETGYQRIQGTKPQTLAYGLTDSPAGLAAWITEKLRSWSDCGGDVERRFTKDQILTLVSIYWHTRTIGTSVRYYHANGSGRGRRVLPGPIRVPQGLMDFPGISSRARMPRSFVGEVPDNVTLWSVHDTGGHFPAIEEPELVVKDLRDFFRPLRAV